MLCLYLIACTVPTEQRLDEAVCDSRYSNQTTLYFGSNIEDGRSVTPIQWERFVEEALMPRFGEGFTVLTGEGHWLDQASGQAVREATWIFIRVNELNQEEELNLGQVITEYKSRFSQQTVLRVDTSVCGQFL